MEKDRKKRLFLLIKFVHIFISIKCSEKNCWRWNFQHEDIHLQTDDKNDDDVNDEIDQDDDKHWIDHDYIHPRKKESFNQIWKENFQPIQRIVSIKILFINHSHNNQTLIDMPLYFRHMSDMNDITDLGEEQVTNFWNSLSQRNIRYFCLELR